MLFSNGVLALLAMPSDPNRFWLLVLLAGLSLGALICSTDALMHDEDGDNEVLYRGAVLVTSMLLACSVAAVVLQLV